MEVYSSDEQRRLEVLRSFRILDTPPEAIFDRLVQLAARICETPIATISLIDERRQWFKSAIGLEMSETERALSFCSHTIHGKGRFIVNDARADPLFRDNPLVVGPPHLVFYAGIPLITPGGFSLGTLAVMDHVPRVLGDNQLASLEMLADQVMMHLELRRQKSELEGMAIQRDEMNAALVSQAEHLQEAQRIGQIGSWELHVDDGTFTWSPEIYRIFGNARQNFLESKETFLSCVHPEDRAMVADALQLAIEGTHSLDIEHRIVRSSGEVRYIHERAELVTGRGRAAKLSGTAQDITEQRRAQEQVNLLGTCIERINDVVMITEAEPIDEPGPRIVFANEAFMRETGYSREEIIGRSPRFLQGPETQPEARQLMRTALTRREPVTVEVINYAKDGQKFWVEIDITPVIAATGRLTHFVAVQRNITERRQREAELARTNRALQMLTRCNEVLVRVENESELLEQVCRIATGVGGYRMAWVGYALHDEQRSIAPMACSGPKGEMGDIARVTVSWSEDQPTGRGPGGRVIRSGRPIVVEDVAKDPDFAPWLASARYHGYHGVIALPLRDKGHTFGLLGLHTDEVRPVADEEIKLLQELADNLAFGTSHIRARENQRRLESVILTVAAGVSATAGVAFFENLSRSMVDALGAQAAFVARFVPREPASIRTLSLVIGTTVEPNFEFPIAGTPADALLRHRFYVIPHLPGEQIALPGPLAGLGIHACAGRRLDDSAGQPTGMLCVLFREPVAQPEFIKSVLEIFAARAAAELERLESDACIRDQAALLDNAKDAIIVFDTAGMISYWNKGAQRLFGWSAEEALAKNGLDLLIVDFDTYKEAMATLLQHGEWSGELRKRRKDGTLLTVECHWTLVRDENGQAQSVFAINTDITGRKEAERAIEDLAFFDPLTRLPNRRLLMDRLQHALAASKRNAHTGALLFIDLDNFKSLNDTMGHDKGDLLLQQVARRLEACTRRSNTVARLGGDEFVVMLEHLSPTPVEAAAQAEVVGEKILAAFNSHPFQLDGYEHHTTPSIGVAQFDHRAGSVEELLKRADLAMYQAKGAGRNTIRFFDPQMQTVVTARVTLEADLRQGLQRQQFSLYYQPQTDNAGKVRAVEALVRWRHAERGMVAPSTFIPLAEETGLIIRLGLWVLEAVCAQLAAWARRPETAGLVVAVNVSARQFHHPDFVKQVLTALHDSGANPRNLKLELTESMLVKNLDDTVTKMDALKREGVGFSLDDFGTGYSSLAYLKRLPLDQLKIDQSFVKDVLTDPNDAAIARTIVALGQILGLEVVAEGVETEEQREFLAQHGCDGYQGFLIGRPLPAEHYA